jgi:hypothetical protein
MTSTAMLPQLGPPTTSAAQTPIVFLGGAPDPRFTCASLTADGLLDERAAIVALDRAADALDGPAAEQALDRLDAAAQVRWLWRVGDAGAHDERFLSGVLSELDVRLTGESAMARYRLRDRWSLVLDERIRDAWWAGAGDDAVKQDEPATMRLAPYANRSRRRHRVRGRSTYVFENGGEAWRLFDALVYLSAVFDLNFQQQLIPAELLHRELDFELALRGSLREVLKRLLARTGLYVDRREGDATARRGHRLRPITRGRPITLTLADRATARSLIERFEAVMRREREAAKLGPGEPVQLTGTFNLDGNWDDSLEGEPSGTYDRGHADFLAHAEVYRRWYLPANDGQAAALVAAGATPSRLPRFRPRSDGGRCDAATGVLVEFSLDGGDSWQDYTGPVTLSPRRAELYLAADALPAGFADAGNAGQLRLRVSAALRQDTAQAQRRVLGNVFCSDHAGDDDADDGDFSDDDGPPNDPDDFTLPPRQAPGGDPHDGDDDDDGDGGAGSHGANSHFAGEPRRGGTSGAVRVALGPVDPGLAVGDLVTKVRGGLSPAVYVQRVGPLRVERIEHDLTGRQQTHLWLRPVRTVQ